MHVDEVPTDADLVRGLLARQFPQWAHLSLEPVISAGTDNALYRLGSDMTVRLPRIRWAVDAVDKEYTWLPQLAPLLPVAVPVPLVRGVPGNGFPWPWTICRWLEGANPVAASIDQSEAMAADIARFVLALREIDPGGGPASNRGEPLATRDHPTRAAIAALEGNLDTELATALWDEALLAPAWSGPPLWIHGDLGPLNLLCSDGRLTGVIDFGTMGVGGPACDLIPAWNLFPASSRSRFRDELGADEATWTRSRGWALSIALIQLPYYVDTNPVLAAGAVHVIEQILIEGSH